MNCKCPELCLNIWLDRKSTRLNSSHYVHDALPILIQEKNPIYRKAPQPSSNPAVADLQDELQMPRVVLEHLARSEEHTSELQSLRTRRSSDLDTGEEPHIPKGTAAVFQPRGC